ncbi:NACHT domain-containing protein [Bisporella sp. PMI_857]|nr:NACHT domain-containing protein [Bisporella sp. PMI_857]
MRLLLQGGTGEFSFREFRDDEIPPYAILLHTWLAVQEGAEPTYEDLKNGSGEGKLGYKKIQFCGEQARRDGLQYFWVDTYCINKANYAELQYAINSMFRWYRNATRCYVYMSDVTSPPLGTNAEFNPQSWDSEFWKSRWFTRGWTLQELLAPRSVEFFCREGGRLGDKNSLKHQIQAITGIPALALQGAPLFQFNRVYSLLGILDVKIPLFKDTEAATAFGRLQEVIGKREMCLQDLRLTDPCDDKKRIEDTKGGLLEDSYRWIFGNSEFKQWRNDQLSPLLWIKGDPGKGKTMLLCGIVNELSKSTVDTALLSYFFCQASDSRINSATAVLRGLIYTLVGKTLFEDTNALTALSEIFTNILQDSSLDGIYLIVDALDECVTGLPELLDLVVYTSSVSSRAKWIVSSRNWSSIERSLNTAAHRFKVDWLAERNRYSSETHESVQSYLSLNANGTFLWVALVCKELSKIPGWKAKTKVTAFPPELDPFYRRMMDQIRGVEDAEDRELCTQVLAVVAAVYWPITLDELSSFIDMPDGIVGEYEALSEIIELCGSFLTLREYTISFVHQSAKDFLIKKAQNEIHPFGVEAVHHIIFSRSLQAMSGTLRRDIYSLRTPGISVDQVEAPNPDPLAAARYSCLYWVDHLLDCGTRENTIDNLKDSGSVFKFLRQSYLYWLEALSLTKGLSDGILMIRKLGSWLQADKTTSSLSMQESEEIPIHGYLTLKTIESKVVYCLTFSQQLLPEPGGTSQRQGIPRSVSSSSDRRDSEQLSVHERTMSRPVRNSRFSSQEDKLLLQLKREGLSWDEISDRFPERSKGTLQVHYSTKLKPRPESKNTRKRRRRGVLFSVIMSVMSLGSIIAPLTSIGKAASTAATFFAMIDALVGAYPQWQECYGESSSRPQVGGNAVKQAGSQDFERKLPIIAILICSLLTVACFAYADECCLQLVLQPYLLPNPSLVDRGRYLEEYCLEGRLKKAEYELEFRSTWSQSQIENYPNHVYQIYYAEILADRLSTTLSEIRFDQR